MAPTILRKIRLLLGATTGLLVCSCQPYNYNGGGITLGFEYSKVIMLDAPQTSCRSAHSTTPTEDLASLSLDIGHLSVHWDKPAAATANAALKLVYISIRFRTSGLSNTGTSTMIAGQDLNCIVHDNPDAGASLSVSQGQGVDAAGVPVVYPFPFELRIGGLTPTDAAKKTSFAGTASVLIYGLIHDAGMPDQPVIGRGTFQFNFGGILQ